MFLMPLFIQNCTPLNGMLVFYTSGFTGRVLGVSCAWQVDQLFLHNLNWVQQELAIPDVCFLAKLKQIMRLMCLTLDKITAAISSDEYCSDGLWSVDIV